MAVESLSQAELILKQQEHAQHTFRGRVLVWWGVILGTLLFIFSGARIQIGPIVLQTIQFDWEFIGRVSPIIRQGVVVTLLLSATSILVASILALLTALARLSRVAFLYALSTFYVSLIRGTPLLLQIVFFFLALPQMGIILDATLSGILALSLNYGAYMSETFRAGIQGVGKGQREAALALGMTPGQMMRRIVLPQALRIVIPPMGNDFIAMLKDSALVSTLGFVRDLMWYGQNQGRREFRSLEALLVVAVWYWGMTIIFTWLQSRLEKRLARGER
ncbi:L-cystine transport system permease protein YecS [Thermoflexales bacterium]|nr:L-cystine transport system permease protein YecS [Thermoflexales bacterium]